MSAYLSTGSFRSRSLSEIISCCETNNIQFIELSSGLRYDENIIRQVLEATTIRPCLIHNYFPPPKEPFVLNLASADPVVLEKSLDLCKRSIDLSARLEAPFYSVHSGFAVSLKAEMLGRPVLQSRLDSRTFVPYEQAYDIFCDSVRILSEYAAQARLKVLLENNVVTSHNMAAGRASQFLMTRPEEFKWLFRDLNDDNVGILLDVGHLNVSAKTLGFDRNGALSQLAPFIGAFHLSENDGKTDQNLPVSESSWFWPFVQHFPDIPLVLEAYALTVEQMLHQRTLVEDCRHPLQEAVS